MVRCMSGLGIFTCSEKELQHYMTLFVAGGAISVAAFSLRERPRSLCSFPRYFKNSVGALSLSAAYICPFTKNRFGKPGLPQTWPL